MAQPLELTTNRNVRSLLRRLQRQLGKQRLVAEITRLFRAEASQIAGDIAHTELRGKALRRRTGTLARSMLGDALVVDGLPAMKIGIFRGPALRYARIHEGRAGQIGPTVIRAGAKKLAIPVGEALTPAGVPRYTSPRDVPGLQFVPWRRAPKAVGGLYDKESLRAEAMAARAGMRKMDLRNAKLLFVLTREVGITPKHYLENGVRRNLPAVIQLLERFLAGRLRGALSR